MHNVLGVDIGGTMIKFGVVTPEGEIHQKRKTATPGNLKELLTILSEELKSSSSYNIEGVAISSPGAVGENGVIYGSSAVPFIHGFNIKNLLEEKLGLSVVIENDANCAAMAEIWNGAGQGKKDIAVIVIGTGIGGAIVKDGNIHKGEHLHGGEVGYMILDPYNMGGGMNTFSELASISSLIKRVRMEDDSKSHLNGEEIFRLADHGDEICKKAVRDFYCMLAVGIHNVQYLYDPEVVLIGGGVSEREELIVSVEQQLSELKEKVPVASVSPRIAHCKHKANANLIGASYHYWKSKKINVSSD